MSITAVEIQEVRFGEVKKGYDPNEVDEFLERVATDVDTLNRALSEAASRIKAAEKRVAAAEKRATDAEQKLAVALETPPPAQAATPPPPTPEPVESPLSGEVIAKAFIAAQKSADALQEEARKEAELVYREAEAKAREIVRDSLTEKQRTISELDHLRESCEKFRTEYLSLLKYFQADAQKRLTAFDDGQQAQPLHSHASSASNQRTQSQRMHSADGMTVSPSTFASNNPSVSLASSPIAPASVSSAVPAGVAGASSRVAPPAVPDPFAPQPRSAYQMSLDDDDLDIEEID